MLNEPEPWFDGKAQRPKFLFSFERHSVALCCCNGLRVNYVLSDSRRYFEQNMLSAAKLSVVGKNIEGGRL
jgi:hypothetical protein